MQHSKGSAFSQSEQDDAHAASAGILFAALLGAVVWFAVLASLAAWVCV